jgi:hypothetical protein
MPVVADGDGPRPLVASGEAAGLQAARAIKAATKIDAAWLGKRRGFAGVLNDGPSMWNPLRVP